MCVCVCVCVCEQSVGSKSSCKSSSCLHSFSSEARAMTRAKTRMLLQVLQVLQVLLRTERKSATSTVPAPLQQQGESESDGECEDGQDQRSKSKDGEGWCATVLKTLYLDRFNAAFRLSRTLFDRNKSRFESFEQKPARTM